GDGFPVFDIDHTQHGDLGHAAHAVEGGLLAVDQAFLGHVLEKALERDLLLALEAERLGDLALSGRSLGRLDELDDLFFRRQAGEFAGARHRGPMAGSGHTRNKRPRRPASAAVHWQGRCLPILGAQPCSGRKTIPECAVRLPPPCARRPRSPVRRTQKSSTRWARCWPPRPTPPRSTPSATATWRRSSSTNPRSKAKAAPQRSTARWSGTTR